MSTITIIIAVMIGILGIVAGVRSMIEKDEYKRQLFRMEAFIMYCYALLLIKS